MADELIRGHATAVAERSSSPDVAKPELPPALPDDEGCKKVRELALRQLDRFISCEKKVLKGNDAGAIHDMRVASRRLQQVLDLLYPKPRTQDFRQQRRKIRRCRRALGDVRNCDVLLDYVGRSLARKRAARRQAWTVVQHFLMLRRAKTFQRTLRKFGKLNLTGFYVDLKESLLGDKAHGHSAELHAHATAAARSAFADNLSSALETTWGRFRNQVAESHRTSRPDVIHRTRIETKRLRYLIEVFHEFKVRGSAEALAWLRQLQRHLGDWHDMEVLEQMMIELVARPEFLRDHLPVAMEVEKLILRNRQTKAEFEQQYSQMARDSAEMHRLKEWVGYLVTSPSAALASG
jgi:CHAD domain-containing protein